MFWRKRRDSNVSKASKTGDDSHGQASDDEADRKSLVVLDDVLELLKRGGRGDDDATIPRLPSYVNRVGVVKELRHVLGADTIDVGSKIKAIGAMDAIMSTCGRGKELDACVDAAVPAVLNLLVATSRTAGEEEVRDVCEFFVRQCLRSADRVDRTLQVLAGADGVQHVEVVRALPDLLQADARIDYRNAGALVGVLLRQLRISERRSDVLRALLTIREILGKDDFERCCRKNGSENDWNTFVALSSGRNSNGEELCFGIIRMATVSRVTSEQTAFDGARLLKRELETAIKSDDIDRLAPHADDFLSFLSDQLHSDNVRVVQIMLECYELVLRSLAKVLAPSCERIATDVLHVAADGKVQLKAQLYRVESMCMRLARPQIIVARLLRDDQLGHENPKRREEVLIVVLFALLQFPSRDVDLVFIASRVAPAMLDTKRRVRQGALECLALVYTCLGSKNQSLVLEAVESAVDDSVYVRRDDVVSATKCRISRRKLARVTHDGIVEYGLVITGKPTTSADADVAWIMGGSGSLSRGSAGSFAGSLGVVGGSAGSMGSTVSMQSLSPGPKYNGKLRRRSRSESPSFWTRHRDSGDEDDYEDDAMSLSNVDDAEIRMHWKNDPRDFTSAQRRERKETYDTISRAQSMAELRAAIDSVNMSLKKEKAKSSVLRGESLVTLGLAKSKVRTLFENGSAVWRSDAESGVGFRHPNSALRLALQDLNSKQWQTELDGLDAIVRLVRFHPKVLEPDLASLTTSVLHETKNLRSQVARAAVQALSVMFACLGVAMETKALENVSSGLLTKTADTNRFIRSDAQAALDSMVENVSVHRAVSVVSSGGLAAKHMAARTCAARLLADVAQKLGWSRLANEKDTRNILFATGVKLLMEPSLDTRTEAKRLMAVLMEDPNFDADLRDSGAAKTDVDAAKKTIRDMKKTRSNV